MKDPISGKTKVTGNKANLKESEFDPYCCPSWMHPTMQIMESADVCWQKWFDDLDSAYSETWHNI